MKKCMEYLVQLDMNNNREWFHAHKEEKQSAQLEFESVLWELMTYIGAYDERVLRYEPKEIMYRLARDMRFYRDRPPYTPSFRGHIGPAGRKCVPVGIYFGVMPQNRTEISGGLFPSYDKQATELVRSAIDVDGAEFERIISTPPFSRCCSLMGEKLKKVPGNFDKDHPQGELLKHKNWYTSVYLPDSVALDRDELIKQTKRVMDAIRPFNEFLNEALKDYVYQPEERR